MKELLFIPAFIILGVFGYRLMAKVDRFLEENASPWGDHCGDLIIHDSSPCTFTDLHSAEDHAVQKKTPLLLKKIRINKRPPLQEIRKERLNGKSHGTV